MNWSYAISPIIWPPTLVVLLMLAMALYIYSRRSSPGAVPFMIGCLFSAAWAAGTMMEFAAVDLATKIFWVKFQTAFQLPSSTMMTCFALEYAWPGRWLTRRNRAVLSVAPLLVMVMILFDHRLHWIWTGFDFNGVVTPQVALGGWLSIAYSFVLVMLNIVILTWLFHSSPQHRWAVVIMITGHIGVRTLYIMERTVLGHSSLSLDVLGLAFIISMYAIVFFGFRIIDPIPLARQTAIEQLPDGVLVLDTQEQVTSINIAGEQILGAQLKQIRGKPIVELLHQRSNHGPSFTSLADLSAAGDITLKVEGELRCFELKIHPLDDFRQLPVGYLLLLHDVSEQRRSQEQLLEQQRALAMMTEREHLARELHDELAQGLALINLQAQLVSGYLEAGQHEQAQAQLQDLARTAREAQVDVRGEIGKLSYHNDPQQDFHASLQHFVQTFQKMYGVHTELFSSTDFAAISPSPTVETQLLAIVQEAFANIRKHAKARHVRVSISRGTSSMLVEIDDDGVGFDPHRLSISPESFGQRIMQQRAAEVGGRVQVTSIPGEGTKVAITVPVKTEAV